MRAVDGISLTVAAGELVALVGESGCGKTTTAQAVMRMLVPRSGSVEIAGQDIAPLSERALRPVRREAQIVFQDPVRIARPALPRARHRGRAARDPPHRHARGAHGARARGARARGPLPRRAVPRPLPARALGRPAAARRDRRRARAGAEAARRRRARLDARRLGARGHPRPARRPPRAAGSGSS